MTQDTRWNSSEFPRTTDAPPRWRCVSNPTNITAFGGVRQYLQASQELRHRRGFGLGHGLFHLDAAAGDERCQRTDGSRHRGDDAADDAGGQRKFSDGLAFLLDHDSPDVPLFDELLELREDLLGRAFELLPERAFHRFDPPGNRDYPCIDEPRTGWFRPEPPLLPRMELVVRRAQPRLEHVR